MSEAHYIKLLEDNYKAASTINEYKKRIKSLRSHLGDAELHTIILDPDTYYPRIKSEYESLTTRKNILTGWSMPDKVI